MAFEVPFRAEPWVSCPGCHKPLPLHPIPFEAYFLGVAMPCPGCGNAVDWWKAVREATRTNFYFSSAVMLAGAETTVFDTTLEADEMKEIVFSDHDVPEEAEIIKLNFTSNGSALPSVQHGNQPFLEPFPNRIFVRGVQPEGLTTDGPLVVQVTWFTRGPTDSSIRHLVQAARHYEAKRFDAVVVPANIAVESKLSPVVHEALSGFCGADKLHRFLNDAATYSHQLNIIVPMIAHIVGAPRLPDDIAGILNRLRGLRNDVVHEGSCREQSEGEAADHIAAALFGIHYSLLLQKVVDEARRSRKLP